MATRMPDAAPLVVMGSRRSRPAFASAGFRWHVSHALTAAATLVAAVTFLHLAVLWGLESQSRSVPQWQFMALARTAETLPWIVLAFALFYTALYASESTSLLAYRLLGLGLILSALIGAGIGVLMITEYAAVSQDIDAQAAVPFRLTAIKTLGICALHVLILAPVGVLGLRRPFSS